MKIVADMHVHLYPVHHPGTLFRSALDHLGRAAEGTDTPPIKLVVLTERSDCRAFADLAEGGAVEGEERLTAEPGPGAGAVTVRDGAGDELLVLTGRQIATRERLEVLAPACDPACPDGLSMDETLERVRGAGGVPVLAWAPGKWWFGRGRLIREQLAGAEAGRLAAGDSSLRPVGWPEPAAFRTARARGCAVVAGSDPLPFPGEERRAGSYGVATDAPFDAAAPAESLRRLLRDPATAWATFGRRGSPLTVLGRLYRNGRASRC